MLVLSRKYMESIVIDVGGLDIIVKVVKFDVDKVRVGISAPDHVVILRAELLEDSERRRLEV